MKRKTKKYDTGGKIYDKEDEGLFGGKVKYREEGGRKYTAAPSNPFDRNPQEQRYYSVGDVKSKLSGLFGGKSDDEPKKSTTMPSGYEKLDASEGNARTRKIEDYIKKSEPKAEEPAEETTPVKKAAPTPRKTAPATTSKASMDSGIPKKTRADEKVGKGYEGLDVREKSTAGSGKNTFLTKERQEAADKAYYAGFKKKPTRSTADIRAGRSVEGMKKGGSVRSASARADGCAIRGKTRA